MAAKSILVLCTAACFLKIISAQCIGAINNMPSSVYSADELALNGGSLAYGAGVGAVGTAVANYGAAGSGASAGYGLNVAPSSGGSFAVTSYSPIAPTGISVVSENAIEGPLSITGQLPFLGVIGLEGALPTSGAGSINYGCGSGSVGIVSEGITPAAGSAGYSGGIASGLGYQGLAGGNSRAYNGLSQAAGLGCRGAY